MERRIRSNNIAFRLAVVFVCFAIFQSILLAAIMVGSGVLAQSRQNEYRIFSEKVNGRKNSLANEMNIWTNFEYDAERMSRYFENADPARVSGQKDEVLEDLAPLLMEMLFRTKTTGAFLILTEEGQPGSDPAALYFRNNNPDKTGRENENLYMLTGPWNVAEEMRIATTANWSFRLKLTADNSDFFLKPYKAAVDYGRSGWLGYWSKPFQVNPQDEDVITYSIPLFDADGRVAAICGVEISVNYLYRFLPGKDFQTTDSYGYIIGTGSMEEGLNLSISHGAVQKRMLKAGEKLQLESVDEMNGIYRLMNHDSSNDIYVCAGRMGMYYHNTPFENEEWYLMGVMEKPVLLQFPVKIEKLLQYALVTSAVIGLVVAIFVSLWFTRHAKLMELSELPLGVFEIRPHSGSVFMTYQVPGLLGLTREQERNFTRDKTLFITFLKELKDSGDGDKSIFKIGTGEDDGFIKITRREAGGAIRCVVEDVTEEVLHTKALRVERDRDGLTGVGNRLAFEKMMEGFPDLYDGLEKPGFVMCDLNDLKLVNDQYGHDKGDEYIRMAADAIRSAFPDGRVYRIGGDEFAVFLEDGDDETVAEGIGQIKHAMEEYTFTQNFTASVAAGYACYIPERDQSIRDVLTAADGCMYENKRQMKKLNKLNT